VEVGDCALDFALLDAAGREHRLSEYEGDIVLIDLSGFS